ncbi:MAG: TauD/TfdA family dioxygenase [Alphaproteobacteria bacterium]|nr:TauD/TfdA family dioxygenase [Alphaproteobacteria bacterium]
MTNMDASMQVVPSGSAIGADILGADLSRGLDAATFRAIEAAFNERSVVCLRDQHLTEEQFIAFAKRFGEVEIIFLTHYAHPRYPEIMLVSNIQENGRNIGHVDAGRVWHTDMSYTATPPRATLLYAIDVPEEAGRVLGDTLFASAVAAYDGLPEAMKRRLEGLRAVHRVSGRRKKTGTGKEDNPLRDRQPDVLHPVIRTHPVTGRKAIYVSEGECTGIVGMEDAEALPLLADLAQRIIRKDYQYRHRWRKGDVLIWDNPAVQHIALRDYEWPRHRRLMHRITVGGSATY